jgi:hypothetical protein
VKIGGLLSLVSNNILDSKLFRDSKRVLISSSIKKLRDLNTKLDWTLL